MFRVGGNLAYERKKKFRNFHHSEKSLVDTTHNALEEYSRGTARRALRGETTREIEKKKQIKQDLVRLLDVACAVCVCVRLCIFVGSLAVPFGAGRRLAYLVGEPPGGQDNRRHP